MGGSQSVSWDHDQDSLTEPGKKSVISSPLDGVDPDALFNAFEKYVRAGKTATGKEAKFEMEDMDDKRVLVLQRFTIPEIFGGGDFATRTVYKFDQAKRKLEASLTIGDVYWERKVINTTGHLLIHADPTRIEFHSDQYAFRASGKFLRGLLEPVVKAMDLNVELHVEQPSIKDEGKTSVVTDVITPGDVTPENFMQKFKEALIEHRGGVELPDGTVAEDRSGILEIWKSFAKHEFEADRSFIYEYGVDETFTVLRHINHLQVHKDPFRLEAWTENLEARFASEPEAKFLQDWAEKVLTCMKEESG
mmetsp:Transcript_18653/g.53480  ORF Transcript_18653/g.53480 Transcript_18653/m.53480 type:complete len:306 (-) Transcript_18653:158-1075(-)